MQREIKQRGSLLNDEGVLTEPGYSTEGVLSYNRHKIKARPWQIKEWDFYQISNDEFCLQMVIGHVSYAGDVSVSLFEFATGKKFNVSKMLVLPFNKLKMPASAEEGDLYYHHKDIEMSFEFTDEGRRLRCKADAKGDSPAVNIDVTLQQSDKTSIVMATPFDEKETYFYYNHKINCMPAIGEAKFGNKTYRFEPQTSFGLLDWGRGVWPFKHEWVWGSGSTLINGKRFGFNLGFGFGNTSHATENILFYDGVAHKLNDIYVDLAEGGYMAKKNFTSDDGRFEMEFTPVHDNYTETKMLLVHNKCHQVFGKFNGKAILGDGKVIEVKDMMAFTEYAVNRW